MVKQRLCGHISVLALVAVALLIPIRIWAQERGTIKEDAPLRVLPQVNREPAAMMEAGVLVDVLRHEGAWLLIKVEGRRGPYTGYVEARFVNIAPPAPAPVPVISAGSAPVPSAPSVPASSRAAPSIPVAPSAPPAIATPVPAPARAIAPVTLRGVQRIYIEKMDNDLDQYISAEIIKEFKGRLVVVLDKRNADAIMRGIGENRTGVGAAITGRYLGLHDNASASITIVDPAETVVIWASEAGDRSLWLGALARGGQRKVADRLVNNLKKALAEAK